MAVPTPFIRRLSCITGLLLGLLLALPVMATPSPDHAGSGVLVVTPDRGFLGNAEVLDAFEVFAKDRNARLLYVTDARSEKVLDRRLAELAEDGAHRIKVLPLFTSHADARWQLALGWLREHRRHGLQLAMAEPYGTSYLAVEDLSDRLRKVHADQQRLLLVGYGAANDAAARTMQNALKQLAGYASTLPADAIDAVVHPVRKADDAEALRQRFDKIIRTAHDTLVVPVAFAPRDDSMMDFSNWFSGDLPDDARLLRSPIAGTQALAQWMRHATIEAGMQFAPLDPSQVGVVALAHGADWFWNRDIRRALAPMAARHKLAFAFSMADPKVVERAVHQLRARGARAIVVVRAFGRSSSFRGAVRRMIGADVHIDGSVQTGRKMTAHGHAMPMMHHSMTPATLAAPPRIRTALPMVTVGGVDDSRLFARALLHNARSVSRHPSRETVILVAHGLGDDAGNQRWLETLASLAGKMKADGGSDFHAIEYATWREDWPDKRKAAVAHVRQMVHQADRGDGRALVVPARINRRGNADRYLEGLDFGWSEGFAQTPYFAQWFEQEIRQGMDKLHRKSEAALPTPSGS